MLNALLRSETLTVIKKNFVLAFWRFIVKNIEKLSDCLLYTSDAADEARSVSLGGRRIITKK
ncbi:hypothetical protein PVA38_11760 [Streptococcus pneumoniae D39]|nr:hypothetical protein PVA38_11760 [Streptococcus pneumoniae D39]